MDQPIACLSTQRNTILAPVAENPLQSKYRQCHKGLPVLLAAASLTTSTSITWLNFNSEMYSDSPQGLYTIRHLVVTTHQHDRAWVISHVAAFSTSHFG